MSAPQGFTWVEKPLLAALARPDSPEDLQWLRKNGIEVLLSLTEDRLYRDWTDAAGLLVYHEPLEDMEPPTQEQLDRCVSAIGRAVEKNMAVAVHCGMMKGAAALTTERKLRLFVCACCRRLWDELKDQRSRDALAVSEQFADGVAGKKILSQARLAARAAAWNAQAARTRKFPGTQPVESHGSPRRRQCLPRLHR